MQKLAALLLLAAVLGASARDLGADASTGRQLLQGPSPTECDRSVKNCVACRFQFFRGTTTKAICTQCATGYSVKNSGRACYCAPGYFTNQTTDVNGQTGFSCFPCGNNAYCPGAKVTASSSSARFMCGANKVTTTEFGKSDRECIVLPGFGWEAGDGSAACPQGFYNPGYNTRRCSKCPGSLTTKGPNSNSTQDCAAPEGFYYLRGKAVACARGTYKEYIGNNDCDECPTGMTTPDGEVSATNRTKCNTVEPGYSQIANPVLGTTAAAECPVNTYRAGYVLANATGPVECTPCGGGMVTLPNVTKATSSDACFVPPGFGWVAPTAADIAAGNTTGAASACPAGSYNPGYNREGCVACGAGTITTDGPGATAADQCFTPAGHGNRRNLAGTLEGFQCPLNTYGRGNKTYGLVDVECTKCQDNTHSPVESTSAAACLTNPGYGWDNGAVNQCDYAYYNPGNNQNKCTYCGDFFNTTNAASANDGEMGSDSNADCKLDFGYTLSVTGGVDACRRGYYKAEVGNTSCSQCPAGTSTTITMAAVARSDCDVCRAGFGVASGLVNLTNPSCARCQSGTFSYGFKRGGEICAPCPQAQNFTGTMVSPQGSTTPEQCVGEYMSDPNNEQNFLWWDTIPHTGAGAADTLVLNASVSTMADCQTTCTARVDCQYFEFYATNAPPALGGGSNKCFIRALSGAAITELNSRISSADETWWNAPTGLTAGQGIVLFEVKDGAYVVYPKKDNEVIGADLSIPNFPSGNFVDARAACDKSAQCVGLTWDTATPGWRPFTATLREDAVGKVRVVGNAINSWVGIPTGTEDEFAAPAPQAGH